MEKQGPFYFTASKTQNCIWRSFVQLPDWDWPENEERTDIQMGSIEKTWPGERYTLWWDGTNYVLTWNFSVFMFIRYSTRGTSIGRVPLREAVSGCKHPGVGWFLGFVHTASVPILDQRKDLPIRSRTHVGNFAIPWVWNIVSLTWLSHINSLKDLRIHSRLA